MTEIKIDFTKAGGLIAAICQDEKTGEVLMLGWQNQEAYELTKKTGEVHFWSRSRKKIWRKGARSGNVF